MSRNHHIVTSSFFPWIAYLSLQTLSPPVPDSCVPSNATNSSPLYLFIFNVIVYPCFFSLPHPTLSSWPSFPLFPSLVPYCWPGYVPACRDRGEANVGYGLNMYGMGERWRDGIRNQNIIIPHFPFMITSSTSETGPWYYNVCCWVLCVSYVKLRVR